MSLPAWSRGQLLGVPLSVGVVLVLALVDVLTGSDTVLVGLLTVGPVLAAVAGSQRQVVGVGVVTVVVQLLLSWPDHLWGGLDQAVFIAATIVMTGLSASAAAGRRASEQSAAAAGDQQRRLAAIVESSDEAIIGKTLGGEITSWNRGAEQMYGYRATEAVGRPMSLIVPPDRQAELDDILARVADGLPTERLETQRRRKNGSVLDVSVSVSPILDAEGRVVGASAAAHDTTATHKALHDLAASDARKTAMLQSSLDAIVVVDDLGRVVDFSPAAERTFGYSAQDAVGRRLEELIVPAADTQRCQHGRERFLADHHQAALGRRVELTARRADGSELPVELTVVTLDLPGRPLLMGFIRDLSELHALDEERDRLAARLVRAERMDSLGQLAGGVAHDFNNLLAVILNYASLLRDTVDDGQVREDVDAITAAAEQAAGLTRKLLSFSRIDPVDTTDVDVNDVVSSIVALLHRALPENIRVVTHLAPVPTIRADRTSLEQVVMNLAVNARDAMPDGGRLTIETGDVHLSESLLGSIVHLEAGRYVRLVVTDNGAGMPDDVRRKAFDPFFSTKARGHGTGLGLATVYGTARQLGGDCALYSEPGRGTTVTLHLPAGAAAVSAPAERRAAPDRADVSGAAADPSEARRTVLLVEDEDLLRTAVCRVLESEGYVVVSASSAEEAIEIAQGRTAPVDLLLTDVILSGRSGPELAQDLRGQWPGLAVLLASGYTERVLTDSLPLDGAWDLIEKPFSLDALLERVSVALSSRT
jgi:PAS domain S-box-containing protein